MMTIPPRAPRGLVWLEFVLAEHCVAVVRDERDTFLDTVRYSIVHTERSRALFFNFDILQSPPFVMCEN